MSDSTDTHLGEPLRKALIVYQDAARIWLDSVGRLGVSERQIADRLAIGRMILLRLRRFVQAEDAISLLEHLPGGRARAEIAETRLPDRLNAVDVADRLITATRDLDAILQRVGSDRDRARRMLASIDDAGSSRTTGGRSSRPNRVFKASRPMPSSGRCWWCPPRMIGPATSPVCN